MNTRVLVLFTAAVLIVPGIAFAGFDRHPGPPGGRFERMMHERLATVDRDGDGTVTAEEVKDARAERFAAADANGDGVLDVDEMVAMIEQHRRERIEARLARFDSDEDGKVTAEEFAAAHTGWFARLDRDDDGAVTTDEMRARRRHGQWGRHDGYGHQGPRWGHGGQGRHGGHGYH